MFRVVDDWFISADEIRQPLLDANATVEWTPAFYFEADGRLAPQHGRLEHPRKRYWTPLCPSTPVNAGT